MMMTGPSLRAAAMAVAAAVKSGDNQNNESSSARASSTTTPMGRAQATSAQPPVQPTPAVPLVQPAPPTAVPAGPVVTTPNPLVGPAPVPVHPGATTTDNITNASTTTTTTGLPFQVSFASPSKVRPPQGRNMSWRRLHSINGKGFVTAKELLLTLHYYKPGGRLQLSKQPPSSSSPIVEFVWEPNNANAQLLRQPKPKMH